MLNAKTPYKNISVGSPLSSTKLKESLYKVDATFIKQINHENDPVANGLLNEDANYEVKYGFKDLKNLKNKDKFIEGLPIINNLLKYHPFESYNDLVTKDIKKVLEDE